MLVSFLSYTLFIDCSQDRAKQASLWASLIWCRKDLDILSIFTDLLQVGPKCKAGENRDTGGHRKLGGGMVAIPRKTYFTGERYGKDSAECCFDSLSLHCCSATTLLSCLGFGFALLFSGRRYS